MGDRSERATAWRKVWLGGTLAVLTLIATAALAVAIPTQGENPSAWGVIVCGVATVAICLRVALRNERLLRHYRGDDLVQPRRSGARRGAGATPIPRSPHARAKAAR
jgi:hypothetical protein